MTIDFAKLLRWKSDANAAAHLDERLLKRIPGAEKALKEMDAEHMAECRTLVEKRQKEIADYDAASKPRAAERDAATKGLDSARAALNAAQHRFWKALAENVAAHAVHADRIAAIDRELTARAPAEVRAMVDDLHAKADQITARAREPGQAGNQMSFMGGQAARLRQLAHWVGCAVSLPPEKLPARLSELSAEAEGILAEPMPKPEPGIMEQLAEETRRRVVFGG